MSDTARLELAQVVLDYVNVAETYRHQFYPSMRPKPGSRADTEAQALNQSLADEWSDEPIALTYGTAELHIGGAQDHIYGLAMLLQTNLGESLMTCARGAQKRVLALRGCSPPRSTVVLD
jgi:hypothetical protein